ncbi:MAG: SRPBCC domain-containing protein [Nostocaceae cyanobacterium]|nr:SRPBCC domain-containing protein [Nostocaceae cyanobacterium]
MLRDLKMDVFYPHPPQRVWRAITNSKAMAAWLMENDFQPRVGHKFRFQYSTLPGLEGWIECEVIELDEPRRLSFTWRDSLMSKPSIVVWKLAPVDGGTRVQLQHRAIALEILHTEKLHQPSLKQQPMRHPLISELTGVTQTKAPVESVSLSRYQGLDSLLLNYFINVEWEYRLNEKLGEFLDSNLLME